MVEIFRDAGLKHIEVEFLQDFFMPQGSPEKAESDRIKKLLFEAAAAFDAHHIKAGTSPAHDCEFEHLAESLAAVCARGGGAHRREDRLRDHPVRPPGQHARGGPRAARAGRRAGQPRARDRHLAHGQARHLARASCARSSPDQLAWVELSDGHFHNLDDFVYEVTCDRSLPGEGEFDIPGYVEALQRRGYPGPWGVGGAFGAAAGAADRGGVRPGFRDDKRAVQRRRRVRRGSR